jgi:cytochrome b6
MSERLPLDKFDFYSLVRKKEVPVHRLSWAYYTGGLALFCFTIQLLTGLLLLFYYQPTVSDAHASVEHITRHIPMGALIRNMHTWTSSVMIACVMIHMLMAFAMKAFERPREITWVTGVMLLLITFGFGFTGYLLPWNQIAVNATKVGLETIEQVGNYLPGALANLPHEIKVIIQGEPSVGQATLSRFYVLHVIVLPFSIFAVLGIHLLAVQLHGMSQGVDRPTGRGERFFPFFVIKDLSLWGALFLILFILALCLPFESFFSFPLFQPYDPLGSTPDGIKPEWYFFFLYYPLELLPFWLVMLGQTVAIAALFAAPWIFRRTSRRTLSIIAGGAAIYLVVITLFGQNIYDLVKGGR